MLYLNRDQIGIPEDLQTSMLEPLGTAFPDAEIRREHLTAPLIGIWPATHPPFDVRFHFPHMASCDGTPEQQALVALCMAQECRKHGIRIVMATKDASFVCAVEEGDTVTDLLDPDRWSFINPNLLGHGDIMHSYPSPDQDESPGHSPDQHD
ncbi:hypothetical protein BJF80_16905 [Serinicoccus sp. CUA-874]|uniref:hypothetical protein n=1 Tax=Serinicoccus sp. CUA-874 TaxID=1517939 RepID=UPI00095ECA5A|nr:hypothetical protein [Serinicoccus sp. CUA-874]OLT17505.1 hypothetical protein BJF80_16905 [Serinicoccus sp. CUA-874]OLT33465.1 hypothetical protein BJF82_14940 [Kytococcus sp. CUA-901]